MHEVAVQGSGNELHLLCYSLRVVVLVVLRDRQKVDGHVDIDEGPGGALRPLPAHCKQRWELFKFPKQNIHIWGSYGKGM